jgi:aminoglycoside phosphotransferase (APT) family kinase protein
MLIDAALVRALIATQFPQWQDLPVRPVDLDGWDNRTFRLGETLSVRLPSAEGYVPQVEKEQLWLPVLAPQLPLPIPSPVALGRPGSGYPWPWSVYRWIEGQPAAVGPIRDPVRFATRLADFLLALQSIDATGGPTAGVHNFHRGGALNEYDAEARRSAVALSDEFDACVMTSVLDSAMRSTWNRAPVWVHGDVAATNLLVLDGELSAVIDFGSSAVGDPACDLTIAWTFLSGEARAAFQRAWPGDSDLWARAAGRCGRP